MNKKLVLVGILSSFVLLSVTGLASSSYVSIDVYYNEQLYPGASTPKPVVMIDEPFTLRFDVKVNQDCKVYADLSDLGVYQGIECFVVIDGPSKLGDSYDKIYNENETFSYEWTLKPTERWAGGSMPIDFHYEIFMKGKTEPLVNSEFTAAYVTISEEYYDGAESTTDSTSNSESESSSPSIPAFTALCAAFALVAAGIFKRK